MSDIQFQAVVGEDGELLEADQDVDMDAYEEYVEAAFPDPNRRHSLWEYVRGSIFLLIVVFVTIAIMLILLPQTKTQTSSSTYPQSAQAQQGVVPTRDRQPLFIIPTARPQPQPIPMPTRPPRESNVTHV